MKNLNLKLKEIARLVEGNLFGDGETLIKRVASLKNATEGDIVFIRNKKNIGQSNKTEASALILPCKAETTKPYIVAKNPALAFGRLVAFGNVVAIGKVRHGKRVFCSGQRGSSNRNNKGGCDRGEYLFHDVFLQKLMNLLPSMASE